MAELTIFERKKTFYILDEFRNSMFATRSKEEANRQLKVIKNGVVARKKASEEASKE